MLSKLVLGVWRFALPQFRVVPVKRRSTVVDLVMGSSSSSNKPPTLLPALKSLFELDKLLNDGTGDGFFESGAITLPPLKSAGFSLDADRVILGDSSDNKSALFELCVPSVTDLTKLASRGQSVLCLHKRLEFGTTNRESPT